MPIRWKSPNEIDPATTFVAFLTTVLVGAKRFAHAALLRSNRALHAWLGIDRFPVDDILGRAGRYLVIHLSQSWGGLRTESPC